MAEKRCAVEGCGKLVKASGLCTKHYRRLRVHGDVNVARVYTKGAQRCRICGQQGRMKQGLCVAHYHRLTRYGDPLGGGPRRPPRGAVLSYALKHMLEGCSFPWPFSTCGAGYPQARLDGRRILVTRYICELVHGPPPSPHHETAHDCNNPSCFHAWCLRWATTVENNADKLIHGTHNRGERHNNVKLTEIDVRRIRALGITTSRACIARQFGISTSHACSIIKRRSWTWLD